ncbi:hypothetical protein Tco_1354238 [Tanacetum coccineum]
MELGTRPRRRFAEGRVVWTALEARESGMIAGVAREGCVRCVTCCGRVVLLLRRSRVALEDDRGVTEGREDVHEVFQQCGSGAKRNLSICGRNQMGNEPILALPEGADDFVVYYNARSKDLEACLEKGEGDCLYVRTELLIGRLTMSKVDGWMFICEFDSEGHSTSGKRKL